MKRDLEYYDDEDDDNDYDNGDYESNRQNRIGGFDDFVAIFDGYDVDSSATILNEQQQRLKQFVPFESDRIATAQQRPEQVVRDRVAYYSLGSLITSLYAHVTEGVKMPTQFDDESHRARQNNIEFDY